MGEVACLVVACVLWAWLGCVLWVWLGLSPPAAAAGSVRWSGELLSAAVTAWAGYEELLPGAGNARKGVAATWIKK